MDMNLLKYRAFVATVEDGMKSIYRITAEPGADIRRAVFDALSQHQLAILSMQQVELSLEDIFLELTGAEPEPEAAPVPVDEVPKKKRRLFGRKRGEDKRMPSASAICRDFSVLRSGMSISAHS